MNDFKYYFHVCLYYVSLVSLNRKWADLEVARNTAGQGIEPSQPPHNFKVLISQPDMCTHVLQHHSEDKYLVQVRRTNTTDWFIGVSCEVFDGLQGFLGHLF